MCDAPEKIWVCQQNNVILDEGALGLDCDVEYTRTGLIPKWSPIETAPKDGTEILGFWQYVYPGDRSRTCGQRVISWEADWNGWLDDEGETHTFGALEDKGLFTHWQPLPAPPKEEK